MVVTEKKVSDMEGFRLEIPLDASGIEGSRLDRRIKVAVRSPRGHVDARIVRFGVDGKGLAKFVFKENPGRLAIAVGPPEAMDRELYCLLALRAEVPARFWKKPQPVFPPIRIPPFYWNLWRREGRIISVRGHVPHPEGRTVPGAKIGDGKASGWWF